MSSTESYRALARYNRWMNRKLYTLAREKLSDEQRKRDLKAFFTSLHGTLHHILVADRVWLGRFTGDAERYASRGAAGELIPLQGLSHIIYESFEDLARERAKTDDDILAFTEGLDSAALSSTLRYRTMRGDSMENPLWGAVTHFFNHQTHHRGQVTTLFMQLGVDPGVTDLIAMLREELNPPRA